jgi:2-oxoglutarate dehydrogenase E2 component (dihydrolipoamide succinyltransferase)
MSFKYPVVMPKMSMTMETGELINFHVAVGDQVKSGDVLFEVMTDKIDMEVEAPADGVIEALVANPGDVVEIGKPVLIMLTETEVMAFDFGTDDEPVAAVEVVAAPAPVVAAPVVAPPVTPPPAPVAAAPTSQPADAYVTPLVRKLATELGVNLAQVTGTGIGGRIRREDVEALSRPAAPAAAAPIAAAPVTTKSAAVAVSPLRGTKVKMSRLRKVIAVRMVESLQVSAQLTTVIEVDVTKIARLRDRSKASFEEREGVKLSFLPFFAVAVCEALKQHPVLNSSVEGDEITYHGAEHLGVAVDTERGLLVPVIANAGDLNMGGIARKIADLAARTRDNKVTPNELGGGTFTLTNTGSRGALFDTPIINQPQVAILGLGAVVKRPMVVRGEDGGETIAIRSMVYLGLSYDHRVVDGADAARFLVTLKERLEGGAFESDLGL